MQARLSSFCILLLASLVAIENPLKPPAAVAAAVRDDRQFIMIFDAGSTGTRLNIFEFRLDSNHSTGLRILSLKEEKISPGLSAYANAPGRLREALKPLMDFAKENVPASFHANTTAIVRATAGLRLLPEDQRRGIVRVAAEVLRRSNFHVPDADWRAVRVISGQEEAEYGWVAVNFLMDAFDQPGGDTYGMLDLGGGSTQITFVPKLDDTSDSYRVEFKTVHGRTYALHEHSYLGLGLSQATLYMLGHNASEPQLPVYRSPCLSPGFSAEFNFGPVTINVTGDQNVATGRDRVRLCSQVARIPMQKVHVHQPPGVKVAKFVAVSSFFYTAKMLREGGHSTRDIPGEASVQDLASAANRACENPRTVGKFEPYLCMSSLFIVTLLRDGYRFNENQTLYITDSIKGYSASWPLGIAIHHLTCHDRKGYSCLDYSSGVRGAQPPSSALLAVSGLTMLVWLRRL